MKKVILLHTQLQKANYIRGNRLHITRHSQNATGLRIINGRGRILARCLGLGSTSRKERT